VKTAAKKATVTEKKATATEKKAEEKADKAEKAEKAEKVNTPLPFPTLFVAISANSPFVGDQAQDNNQEEGGCCCQVKAHRPLFSVIMP
jgi:hypothetical protein